MTKIITYIVFSIIQLITFFSFAQQEPALLFTTNHMNLINPAFASLDDESYVRSSVNKQWSGVQFAPETQAISFGTPLGNNLNLGLSVVNDKTFVEKETFIGVDLSYKLQLDRVSNLYFGVKMGASNYNVNVAGLETYNVSADPALSSISNFNPNVGIGVVYKINTFYVSFSVPKLLNTVRAKNSDGYAALFSDTPHLYLGSGYDVFLDDSNEFTLKPSVLLRYVNGAPLAIDLNAMIDYNDKFELGFLYRTSSVVALKAMIKISNRFYAGYGYEMGSAQLANAGNSNEFFMQFKF
jgi:type IX secretion system PorP/SprF family membrane protein